MIDFTARDYDSLIDLADTTATELLPEWTSRDDEDLNWVTIKTICKLLSINNFYIDLAYNEQHPETVQIYENALAIAKRKNMPINKKMGASTTLTVSRDDTSSTLELTRGTTFTSPKGNYVLVDAVSFGIGESVQQAYVTYGKRVSGSFTNTGTPYMSFKIDNADITNKSVRVQVNGIDWEEEIDALPMRGQENVYKLWLDTDGKYIIEFGDGIYGNIPVGSITWDAISLDVSDLGRLPKNNITKCSNAAITQVNQPLPCVGGNTDESIESITSRLKDWELVQNRVVTTADARFLAKSVPGVSDAKVKAENLRYYVYIVADGGIPSAGLLTAVEDYLTKRKVDMIELQIGTLSQVDITGRVTITLTSSGSRSKTVAAFEDKLSELNVLASRGNSVELIKIYEALLEVKDSVPGVQSAYVETLHRSSETPKLGDVILGDDESGNILIGVGGFEILVVGGL